MNSYKLENPGIADSSVCFDWDDEIQNDGQEFITLPEGDYVFEVVEFERGRFAGSEKVPACNKANLVLEVKTPEGTGRVYTGLKLCKKMEWLLSAFFCSIGQKQKGERVRMDWSIVSGARGRAHIRPRKYTAGDGSERTANELVQYLDYDPAKMPGVTKDGFVELGDEEQEELPF